MKTWLKTALISGVLCCAVGAVLTAAGMLTGGKQYVQAADINTLRGDARRRTRCRTARCISRKMTPCSRRCTLTWIS